MARIYKLGDIVKVDQTEFKGMGKLVGFDDNELMPLEVECRSAGRDLQVWTHPDRVEIVRESNMVESEIQWPNRNPTIRAFDLNDHNERAQFASLAAQCYLMNGTVVVRGCNKVLCRMA